MVGAVLSNGIARLRERWQGMLFVVVATIPLWLVVGFASSFLVVSPVMDAYDSASVAAAASIETSAPPIGFADPAAATDTAVPGAAAATVDPAAAVIAEHMRVELLTPVMLVRVLVAFSLLLTVASFMWGALVRASARHSGVVEALKAGLTTMPRASSQASIAALPAVAAYVVTVAAFMLSPIAGIVVALASVPFYVATSVAVSFSMVDAVLGARQWTPGRAFAMLRKRVWANIAAATVVMLVIVGTNLAVKVVAFVPILGVVIAFVASIAIVLFQVCCSVEQYYENVESVGGPPTGSSERRPVIAIAAVQATAAVNDAPVSPQAPQAPQVYEGALQPGETFGTWLAIGQAGVVTLQMEWSEGPALVAHVANAQNQWVAQCTFTGSGSPSSFTADVPGYWYVLVSAPGATTAQGYRLTAWPPEQPGVALAA